MDAREIKEFREEPVLDILDTLQEEDILYSAGNNQSPDAYSVNFKVVSKEFPEQPEVEVTARKASEPTQDIKIIRYPSSADSLYDSGVDAVNKLRKK